VANLAVATNHPYKDSNDQWQDEVEWHRIVVFGRRAEVIGEHLKKGSPGIFAGRLRTKKWQDQNGNDRYTTELIANDFQFAGGNNSGGPNPNDYEGLPGTGGTSGGQDGQDQSAPQGGGGQPDFDQDFEEDIPFAWAGPELEWRVS